MKKNITRIVLLALSTVLTLTLVFGLAGCAPSGPTAYTAAAEAWDSATSKKAVDEITVSAVMNLGNTIGTAVTIGATIELTREYGAKGEVEEIGGKIKTVTLSGIKPTIGTTLNSVSSMFGITLPAQITSIVTDGLSLVDPAYGTISFDGEEYTLSGTVDIEDFDLTLTNEEDPLIVTADVVDGALEDFDIEIPFDLLTIYGFESSAITKENTVAFTGEAGFNFILVQVYALLDNLFEGNVEFDGEDIIVPQEVVDIVTGVCGSTDSEDIKDYLIGASGLIDLGDVALAITYDKDKKFDTISGTEVISFAIEKSQITDILNLQVIQTLLASIESPIPLTTSLITSAMSMLGIPNTITAEITVSFTTTYTY